MPSSEQRVEGLPDYERLQSRLLIGGEWVDAAAGETVPTIDPATNRTIVEVAAAQAEDVDRAVRAARARSRRGATSIRTSALGSCSASPS